MTVKAASLRQPEFLRATVFWALRKLTGFQVHDVFAISLSHHWDSDKTNHAHRFSSCKNDRNNRLLDPLIEGQLNNHSGPSCKELLDREFDVYYALDDRTVAVQLNMLHGQIIVDSPIDLQLCLGPRVAFLNYLYTHPEYRGRGLARSLMAYACSDQQRQGMQSCLAHVRSTNYSSQRVFGKAGWKRQGKIVTRRGGLTTTHGCGSAGLAVKSLQSA